jgi:hypothetical protein
MPENKTHRALMGIALALAAAIFFIYTRNAAPDRNAVNGTYRSACCDDVTMRDGELFYKSSSSKYDLKNMKFGLTAYVHGKLTESGVEPSGDDTAFIFFVDGKKRGFRTVVRNKEYSFLKIR